jgi:4-hydroxy-tetrahydrodipicolinate reductase
MKETCNLKIGLIGANGRLGQEILVLCDSPVLFTRESPCREDPEIDVYIDVSSKEALSHNLSIALLSKKPIVIGTTGHENLSKIIEASHQIPIFYTPNFSLGLALMRKLASELSLKFHQDAQIDLIETHHNKKKDAPSGSALLLAQSIHPKPVQIHSIRSGQVTGSHIIFFNHPEENITISHEAHNRVPFAKGALQAAAFLKESPPGFYGMDQLIN